MKELTYEQFGRRFFEVAVTEERIATVFGTLAGGSMKMGPIASGPAGLAKVTATVDVGDPRVKRTLGELITFTVEISLHIKLLVDLRVDRVRYDVDGLIILPLTARAAEPLVLHIDITPPRSRDVVVGVSADNLRGEVLRAVGQVDVEIKRFIAQYIADEIEKPEVLAARTIDVGAELGKVFEAM